MSEASRDRFASVGAQLIQRSDPGGTSLVERRARALLAEDNPTSARCRVRLFTVGELGRVAAIINPRLVDEGGTPIGLLGLFECIDDSHVARDLLAAGSRWLAGEGCSIVRGPIDFTTFHNYRFTVSGHDSGAIPGEPVHPAFYPRLWTDAGFERLATYSSNWVGDTQRHINRFARRARGALEAGYTIRRTNADERDLELIYEVIGQAFAPAFMYSPIDWAEFRSLYSPALLERARDLTYLALAPNGDPAGFFFGYELVLQGRRTQICKTVAAAPEHQGAGVYGLLGRTWLSDHTHRIDEFSVALMHCDGSPSLLGLTSPDSRIKEYALYERAA